VYRRKISWPVNILAAANISLRMYKQDRKCTCNITWVFVSWRPGPFSDGHTTIYCTVVPHFVIVDIVHILQNAATSVIGVAYFFGELIMWLNYICRLYTTSHFHTVEIFCNSWLKKKQYFIHSLQIYAQCIYIASFIFLEKLINICTFLFFLNVNFVNHMEKLPRSVSIIIDLYPILSITVDGNQGNSTNQSSYKYR
jgi:hypothetical protein